jgi:hypothetical protein
MSISFSRVFACYATHFIGPTESSLFLSEGIVVLLADSMATLENDKSSIIVTARCQVHETLNASEARALGIYEAIM